MITARIISVTVFVAVCGIVAGCGAKKKEVTDLQRKESAHLASDAQFAMSVRDYGRAETSLAKASELTPDDASVWVNLGVARMKLGKKDAARSAYKRALEVHEAEAKSDKKDSEPWLGQVYVLALLGRANDARAVAEKAAKQFPEDREVKAFVDGKQLDRMLADPKFKEMAL